MENFFYNDEFFNELSEFLDSDEIYTIGDAIDYIEDDEVYECQMSILEPIFEIHGKIESKIIDYFNGVLFDAYEHRYPEEDSEYIEKEIKEAIKKCIDFEKLQLLLPKLHYANGEKFTITKQDILNHFK